MVIFVRTLFPLVFCGVLAMFIMTGCAKESCSTSQVCVRNETGDTVYYCFGCNFYSEMLLPGESACKEGGEVSRNSSYVTYFNSDHGSYAIDVDQCFVEFVID